MTIICHVLSVFDAAPKREMHIDNDWWLVLLLTFHRKTWVNLIKKEKLSFPGHTITNTQKNYWNCCWVFLPIMVVCQRFKIRYCPRFEVQGQVLHETRRAALANQTWVVQVICTYYNSQNITYILLGESELSRILTRANIKIHLDR